MVSQNKARQNSAQADRRLQRLMFDATGAAMWRFDPSSGLVETTPELRRLTGIRRARMTLDAFCDALGGPDRAAALRAMVEAVGKGRRRDPLEHKAGAAGELSLRTSMQAEGAGSSGRRVVGVSQLVARAVSAEEARRTRLDQLARATEKSPAPSALFDWEGRLQAANSAFEEIANIRGEACRGRRIEEILADPPPGVLEMHRQVLEGAAVINEEEVFVDRNGRRRWLQCEYRPIRLLEGGPVGYVVHGREITSLVEARREAVANAERLKLALNAAGAGVYELDVQAKTFWCSPEFVQIIGRNMTFDEAAGPEPWPMTHPDHVDCVRAIVARRSEPGPLEPMEMQIVLPSGEARWMETQAERSLDETGAVQRIVGFVLDIDARKRQELALLEARAQAQKNAERLRVALNAARAGVYEIDFKAEACWCSPEFVKVIGRPLTFAEAAGACWPMTHPDDRERVTSQIADCRTKARKGPHPMGRPLDMRVVLPTGETRWVQLQAEMTVDEQGEPERIVGFLLDVDARKRQELALTEARRQAQENADRLRLALNAGGAGVYEVDLERKSFWCSPEFVQVIGRPLTFEEATGPWPCTHPDDLELMKARLKRLGSRKPGEVTEARVVLPSGETRWVQSQLEVSRNRRGRVVRMVGLVVDIDARKREQLALQEARREIEETAERLGLALDASRAGVFETDLKNKRFWCSPEFTALIGRQLTYEEATSEVWPVTHPEDRELCRAWASRSTETGMPDMLEFRVVLPDGGTRWLEACGKIHRDGEGEVSKVVGLFRDADARKRQELALIEARRQAQSSAERLKIALDAGQAGVFETDFKNRSFWCSPQFAEIVGRELTFEEAAQRSWPMTHRDDVERVSGAIAESAAGPHARTRNFGTVQSRVVLSDGEVRWIDTCAELYWDDDGQLDKVVGLVLNIDARKKQELELIEAQRVAEAATEAKSQFLANMSHEIRTPMNGVLGVLHLLEREPMSPEAKRLLGEAQGCGQMLAQLLNDVIDFSKIEAGRLELTPEPLNVADALNSVVEMLRPMAESKGLELVSCARGEDGWIMVDPVRLRQALFNLIGNAVKFTSEGRVEARLYVTDESGGAKRVRFEIEDTGIGIAADAQEHLFQRFHQADGSTARRFGGSGLGLAITRTLAEMMGGEVGFLSTEGEGSTFWFDVPAPSAPPAETRARIEPLAALNGLRVLVVEDNPTNQLVATKILEGLGANVATAADGVLGLEAVTADAYDLVLMDVQMPRMDGVEASRRIRALGGESGATPIIGLTANALAHQRPAYLAAGMNGVAAKPISPPELLAEIARVLAEAENRDSLSASAA